MLNRPLIVFDVGSTLIHPNFCRLADWLAGRAEIAAAPHHVERAFRRALAGDPFQTGDEDRKGEMFFTLCGCPVSRRERWRAWWREIEQAGGSGSWLYSIVDPEAVDTLERLKSFGCRLVAASNSDGTLDAELAASGLAGLFEATFDSAKLGFEKPRSQFYNHVLSVAGTHASVHVGDDMINDFIGPMASGFDRALVYDPANVYAGLPADAKIGRLSELDCLLGRIR